MIEYYVTGQTILLIELNEKPKIITYYGNYLYFIQTNTIKKE